MTVRRAVVTGATSTKQVAAYLPSNYRVTGYVFDEIAGRTTCIGVEIEGTDNAGWTLEDYVIPRLASGLMGCSEVK